MDLLFIHAFAKVVGIDSARLALLLGISNQILACKAECRNAFMESLMRSTALLQVLSFGSKKANI